MDNKNKPDLYKNHHLPQNRHTELPEELYQYNEINNSDSINIRDYIEIILRRKWILVLSVLFCLITITISTFLQTPLYKATATIEISPISPKLTSFQIESEGEYSIWNTAELYETHYKLLMSKSFAQHVTNKMGLVPHSIDENTVEENKSFLSFLKGSLLKIIGNEKTAKKNNDSFDPYEESKKRKSREISTLNSFMVGLSITPDAKSRLTYINYVSDDPSYSTKAVNTIADEYIRWTVQRKHGSTKMAREFLETQLDQSKANLEQSEEE
ncbi:MAG: Wzz/FepE/Etk N-terminal domain-containing protein, partial [Thermodesulfobacteriota bacterium]